MDPAAARFMWRAVPNATAYTFQLATDEAFANLVITTETDAVRLTLAGLQGDAVYYWRVQAHGAEAAAIASPPAMFRTHAGAKAPKASVPAPLSPVGGIPADASAATLRWTSVPRATAYQVQVSTRDDFSELAFDMTLDDTTSLTLYSLLPEDGTTYYWRVRCEIDKGWRPWSAPVSFHATDDLKAEAFEEAVAEARTEADRLEAQWREAHAGTFAEAPYLTGKTSLGAIVSFALVMILSFVALIVVLLMAVA